MKSPFSSCFWTPCVLRLCAGGWRDGDTSPVRFGPGSSQLKREGAGQANKQLQHPATAPRERESLAAPVGLGAWGSLCPCSLDDPPRAECSLPAPDKTRELLMQSLLAVARVWVSAPGVFPAELRQEKVQEERVLEERNLWKQRCFIQSFLPSFHQDMAERAVFL